MEISSVNCSLSQIQNDLGDEPLGRKMGSILIRLTDVGGYILVPGGTVPWAGAVKLYKVENINSSLSVLNCGHDTISCFKLLPS